MATIQSLVNGVKAAIDPITPAAVPAPPPALGTDTSMQFVTLDDITVPPGGFSGVYAFGDSLSDAGNVSLGTLGTVPVGDIYSGGRFTNGNVWAQARSKNRGPPPQNPGWGGGRARP